MVFSEGKRGTAIGQREIRWLRARITAWMGARDVPVAGRRAKAGFAVVSARDSTVHQCLPNGIDHVASPPAAAVSRKTKHVFYTRLTIRGHPLFREPRAKHGSATSVPVLQWYAALQRFCATPGSGQALCRPTRTRYGS
jgi:hypothetical protein